MNKYITLLASFLKGEMLLEQKMLGLDRSRRISLPTVTNYVRTSTLELVAQEIYENNVTGSVAELGVYKGHFSKYINRLFPDRTLYLFDTFQGFDEKDSHMERDQKFSTSDQDFGNTSIEEVLSRMPHRDKCVVKQGWFPQSLQGLEDSFCFVSLDADLYNPIYEGLEYFHPRLNKGGYIFIHDYNNKDYKGAMKAVRDFCKKTNISYTPMSDTWGSAIISK